MSQSCWQRGAREILRLTAEQSRLAGVVEGVRNE